MSEKQNLKWLLVILLLAWGLRIGFVFWLQNKLDATGENFLIAGDAEGYWELAKTIANGEKYAVHHPPRYVHRMPGFPFLLSLSISLFGESLFAARLMLATIGAFTCFLVYLLGKHIHGEKIGLIAAGLLAISPAAIGFSGLILSETTFGCTMIFALLCFKTIISRIDVTRASGDTDPLWQISLMTGVVIASGVYIKPSWILMGPIAALCLVLFIRPRRKSTEQSALPHVREERLSTHGNFHSTGQKAKVVMKNALFAATLIIGGMLFVLLPWGLRNQMVTGHFKLTTFWMGPSLYDGLNPNATGDSDMRFFDEDQLTLEMSEYEVDQEYKRRAINFARQNPQRVAQLAVAKLWRYWKPWPNAEQFDKPLISIGLSMYTLPLFLLAILGSWVIRGEIWSIVILAGPVFYFAGLHMIFVSSLRYRLPAEAPLSVLAAIGLASIWDFMQRNKERDLISG